jgi:outer membrane protein, heavy metal efflux system
LPKARAVRACAQVALWFIIAGTPMAALPADSSAPAESQSAARPTISLAEVASEALRANPEIQAALKEREAAQHKVAPAGALDDPMLEAGVLNLPTGSLRFDQEDMTMKMIGLSQRFPYSGKRELRRDVAARDAESVGHAYRETVNRVLREIRIGYYDLALAVESQRLTGKNRTVLGQLLKVAESRYAAGQGSQTDVLKAQTQFTRMLDELLRLERERTMAEDEIGRLLARHGDFTPVLPALPAPNDAPFLLETLEKTALQQRPQLLALQGIVARNERALDLARKESLPDFDVKFSYGQRDNSPSGIKRSDMVTLTVAMNLPVWRETKTQPRIAQALAMRGLAVDMLHTQQHDITTKLHHQIAAALQNRKSVRLYERDILPVARLTLESALAAYQVSRTDFLTLLDNQMSVFNYEINSITALVGYHKSIAEMDFITGQLAVDALGPADKSGEEP